MTDTEDLPAPDHDAHDPPRLTITISLDSNDPVGLYSFLRELPWVGIVDGWTNFDATLTDTDGRVRDAKAEAFTETAPVFAAETTDADETTEDTDP